MTKTSASIAQKEKIFSSALSRNKDWRQAARETATKAKADLMGRSCDAALFFMSEPYPDADAAELSSLFSKELGAPVLLGCNASGVIGQNHEIEMGPALSLLAMSLPGVKISPFSLSEAEIASLNSGAGMVQLLDIYPTDKPSFLCLADPMSCDADKLLGLFNAGYPGRPVVGGMASGPAVGRESWLSLGGAVEPATACGLALSGDLEIETVVSQGCRPIGEPFIITKAEGHMLYSLASRPAVKVLLETIENLSPVDRALARHSLLAGLVMNEYQSTFKRGDFLIRNLMGSDPAQGALMVGAELRPGQTLQFQLRDAKTSAEDLEALLKNPAAGRPAAARGALLVSCCGRGRGLYGRPDHDIGLLQSLRGPLPVAGFFANGEFGSVAGKNYVHGYTSSLAIFR
ncbi:MAG TPA: FIST N-terminal domain-containing protein [Elusimicrobiota bacterium]|nr:FIST N-terminal domain-containing protein [Elusimicrobiota bacterium]